MSLSSNQNTLKQSISSQVSEFIQRVQKIYQVHDCDFQLSRAQIFETILNFILPSQDEPMNNQALSHFLQSTLNNEIEKKLKKKYLMKDMTQVSSHSKIFGKVDSVFMSYSNIRDSTISHKSAFSCQTPYNKSTNCLENLLPPDKAIKREQFSNSQSRKQDSLGSIYNSKSSQVKSKRSYKLYPTNLKLGGRKPIDPRMQEQVCSWLQNELSKGTILTHKIIRDKAKKISGSNQFKASKGWLQKFFKRRPQLFEAYSQNRKGGGGPFGFGQCKGEESDIGQVKKQEYPLIENVSYANQDLKLIKFEDEILKLEGQYQRQ